MYFHMPHLCVKSTRTPKAWAAGIITILGCDKVSEIGLHEGKIISVVCFFFLSVSFDHMGHARSEIWWIRGGHVREKGVVGQGGLGRRLLPSVCIHIAVCVRNQLEDMNPTNWAERVREMMISSLLGWEKITNGSVELQSQKKFSVWALHFVYVKCQMDRYGLGVCVWHHNMAENV